MVLFYSSVMESILTFRWIAWYSSLSVLKWINPITFSNKIVGQQQHNRTSLYETQGVFTLAHEVLFYLTEGEEFMTHTSGSQTFFQWRNP